MEYYRLLENRIKCLKRDIFVVNSDIIIWVKKMKYKNKIIFFAICFFLFHSVIFASQLDISSTHAILYQLDENKILYEKKSDERTKIASITKLMTAIIVVENVKNLDEKVRLRQEDFFGLIEQNAATASFISGEEVTYRDLLYGLLLPSGADAAQALTRLVSNGEKNFVEKMNQKAKKMGLLNTHFENATGFDSKNHYSTVKEVSQIFQYALKIPTLKKILTTNSYTTSNKRLTFSSTVLKHKPIIPYLQGGKTGTTNGAGLCLASFAHMDGANFLLVTTGAPYDKKSPHNFQDAKTIYEYFIIMKIKY